jgi:hypothetical protein
VTKIGIGCPGLECFEDVLSIAEELTFGLLAGRRDPMANAYEENIDGVEVAIKRHDGDAAGAGAGRLRRWR